MKKRVIGGTGFVTFFVLLTFTTIYPLMYLFFGVVGMYELVNIYLNKKSAKPFLTLIYGIIFLLGLFSMYSITHFNSGFMLYIAVVVMFSDTFAYFVGKRFGKHKLSKISPKKTIEGALGGMVLGILVANLLMYILKVINLKEILFFDFSSITQYMIFDNLFIFIAISFGVVILALVGDLLESKVKRTYEVKDSGTIVYGHGGILDRLDSWVLASIYIYLIITLL